MAFPEFRPRPSAVTCLASLQQAGCHACACTSHRVFTPSPCTSVSNEAAADVTLLFAATAAQVWPHQRAWQPAAGCSRVHRRAPRPHPRSHSIKTLGCERTVHVRWPNSPGGIAARTCHTQLRAWLRNRLYVC